ncbi:hypothetical protein FQN57_007281 [Myotisia sp. PD_48]|nr:hypothetical protein FQN57_007281 [Myotisia sp. PD_48]
MVVTLRPMLMRTDTIPANHPHAELTLAACSYAAQTSWWQLAAGWTALAWYTIVMVVCAVGTTQIHRKYSKRPAKAYSTTTLPPPLIPHVTIIRPIKGLEPFLYENLAAGIRQDYPRDKLTIYFCISSPDDPALPVVQRVIADFPDADTRLYLEPAYLDYELGPNPKIRNISRAYHEAKGDIVWIVDCNVWLGKGVCGRMVDRLCGLGPNGRKYKFVHHLPLAIDIDHAQAFGQAGNEIFSSQPKNGQSNGTLNGIPTPPNTKHRPRSPLQTLANSGGRLEELFFASAHAKMYCAINTVLLAPCIVGKSTMFRRSHLDYLTPTCWSNNRPFPRRPGVDYFSDNICEDHLIGDRLWKGKIFEEVEYRQDWGKHDLVFGDLAIQPLSGMTATDYIDRRVRWLRVRKFTVLLATLVEPGTEAFLCSAYLAYGLTTSVAHLLFAKGHCFPVLSTWTAFFSIWLASILVWISVDYPVYRKLHSAATIEVDEHTPSFARSLISGSGHRRSFTQWLYAWLGREFLALPIWLWSFYGGATVVWKGRKFGVRLDNVVHEINPEPAWNRDGTSKSRRTSRPSYGVIQNGEVRRRTPTGSFTRMSIRAASAAIDLDETSRLI